jgi:hypothetical protein
MADTSGKIENIRAMVDEGLYFSINRARQFGKTTTLSLLRRKLGSDVTVDFGPDQFILELKLWKGAKKHQDAYGQLCGYLDSKGAHTGYLLTFDFREDAHKQAYAKWITHQGKQIFDVVV